MIGEGITQGYFRDESEIPNGWVPLSGYDSGVRTPNGRTPSREYKFLWDAIEQGRLSCLQKFTGLGKKGGRKYVPRISADALLVEYANGIADESQLIASVDECDDCDSVDLPVTKEEVNYLGDCIRDLTVAIERAAKAFSTKNI